MGDSGAARVSSVTECTSTPRHPRVDVGLGCLSHAPQISPVKPPGERQGPHARIMGAVCDGAAVGMLCALWPAQPVCSDHSGCFGPLALGWRRGQSGRLVFALSFTEASRTPHRYQFDFVIC